MRNHKMTTALLTALTAMAIVAPGATAQPIDSATPMAASALPAGLNGGYGPEGSAPTASHQTPATTAGPASDGFDWGAAGLGAAAMLSVLGLGAVAATAVRRSRHGHPAVS